MNILITNDDGINAQGIAVLARAAAEFGHVTLVAPARQWADLCGWNRWISRCPRWRPTAWTAPPPTA